MTPRRIQRRRARGWRMPAGAVYVGRPTRWGNPYIVGDLFNGGNIGRAESVGMYARALREGRLQNSLAMVRRELGGLDLACWCPLDQPCHADVLLRIANGGDAP